jgi:DNA repair exonuclease SbcCD ATPase subunit
MRTVKIKIRNLFGIREMQLGGGDIELTGKKGTGKTSVIDAIRYALTNASDRDYVVRNGETEGEIIIETDTGLTINRKKRTDKVDYKSVKEFGKEVDKPQSFLNEIFTPLQLDPIAFTRMSRQEQNRTILDLIDFPWDMNWIKQQFGEIPPDVDYEQNILQILNDIQAENGYYFQRRQDVNRDVRNKQAMVNEIAKDIPQNYDAPTWETYDLGATYKKIEAATLRNNQIQRAKTFRESYNNKKRALEADREIAVASAEKAIAAEKTSLTASIERMRAEIKAAEDKIAALGDTLKDKLAIAESQYNEQIAKLDADVKVADEYADKEPVDVSPMNAEVANAEAMKKHLNEFARMRTYQTDVERLKAESDEFTRKIELARTLPGVILETATLPIAGMEVKNGIPLIHGLPVSNLSDGEKLDLCVDVTIGSKGNLKMILINGAECLDDESRAALYAKCKARGLQIIAARTTNDDELEVTEL